MFKILVFFNRSGLVYLVNLYLCVLSNYIRLTFKPISLIQTHIFLYLPLDQQAFKYFSRQCFYQTRLTPNNHCSTGLMPRLVSLLLYSQMICLIQCHLRFYIQAPASELFLYLGVPTYLALGNFLIVKFDSSIGAYKLQTQSKLGLLVYGIR